MTIFRIIQVHSNDMPIVITFIIRIFRSSVEISTIADDQNIAFPSWKLEGVLTGYELNCIQSIGLQVCKWRQTIGPRVLFAACQGVTSEGEEGGTSFIRVE